MEVLIPGIVVFGLVILLNWLISKETDDDFNYD